MKNPLNRAAAALAVLLSFQSLVFADGTAMKQATGALGAPGTYDNDPAANGQTTVVPGGGNKTANVTLTQKPPAQKTDVPAATSGDPTPVGKGGDKGGSGLKSVLMNPGIWIGVGGIAGALLGGLIIGGPIGVLFGGIMGILLGWGANSAMTGTGPFGGSGGAFMGGVKGASGTK